MRFRLSRRLGGVKSLLPSRFTVVALSPLSCLSLRGLRSDHSMCGWASEWRVRTRAPTRRQIIMDSMRAPPLVGVGLRYGVVLFPDILCAMLLRPWQVGRRPF